MIKITCTSEEATCRVDRFLRKRLPLMSLSEIYSLIRKGGVKINDKRTKQDYRLQEDDSVEIQVDQSELASKKSPDQSLESIVNTSHFKHNFKIIYEDSDLLACNKPSGLVVHPGTGHLKRDTLIDLATGYLLSKGELKNGEEVALVHRLDRDTSGIILIAKSKNALRKIHEIFRSRDLVKHYIAICHGRPPNYEGEIVLGLTRKDERNSGMKMRVDDDGEYSKSTYRLVEYNNEYSKVDVFLETGKTHQIRVHLTHVGAPIVGDERYGNPERDQLLPPSFKKRLCLHAYRLSFNHPVKGKKITLEAPLPPEFMVLFQQR
ncbi:MAG: RluA family pseudouridine synthase [Fibrobacterota bacterium]|nr:RluA family pseudouridine synthase [Chitinispirillaceae bacterium]